MIYTVSVETVLALWTPNKKGELVQVTLPRSTYTMEDGRSPNGHAAWLTYRHKGKLCGGMHGFIEGQRGVRISEPH